MPEYQTPPIPPMAIAFDAEKLTLSPRAPRSRGGCPTSRACSGITTPGPPPHRATTRWSTPSSAPRARGRPRAAAVDHDDHARRHVGRAVDDEGPPAPRPPGRDLPGPEGPRRTAHVRRRAHRVARHAPRHHRLHPRAGRTARSTPATSPTPRRSPGRRGHDYGWVLEHGMGSRAYRAESGVDLRPYAE